MRKLILLAFFLTTRLTYAQQFTYEELVDLYTSGLIQILKDEDVNWDKPLYTIWCDRDTVHKWHYGNNKIIKESEYIPGEIYTETKYFETNNLLTKTELSYIRKVNDSLGIDINGNKIEKDIRPRIFKTYEYTYNSDKRLCHWKCSDGGSDTIIYAKKRKTIEYYSAAESKKECYTKTTKYIDLEYKYPCVIHKKYNIFSPNDDEYEYIIYSKNANKYIISKKTIESKGKITYEEEYDELGRITNSVHYYNTDDPWFSDHSSYNYIHNLQYQSREDIDMLENYTTYYEILK